MREPFSQRDREALELVILDELVKVHTQQLENDMDVIPESKRVFDPDDVLLITWVFVSELF
jgi:hypothetical protein